MKRPWSLSHGLLALGTDGPESHGLMVGLPVHIHLLCLWQECCGIRSGLETERLFAIT